jgi:hypothetical protein
VKRRSVRAYSLKIVAILSIGAILPLAAGCGGIPVGGSTAQRDVGSGRVPAPAQSVLQSSAVFTVREMLSD